VGLLSKLFGGGEPDKEKRGEGVAARLDTLAQLDDKWSSERLRRRVRDVFFAVQRSWIERDPSVGDPFMAEQLRASQKLRIEGLVRQHRVHQLENPLIEDLDFSDYSEAEDTVTVVLELSLVETILDDRDGRLVAGAANTKLRRRQFWTFRWIDGGWLLDDVEQPDAGARHLSAPLVGGDDLAALSPEMMLRERYARGEIELDEFEAEMAKLLGKEKAY
jgi:Tim44-like domain